MPMNILAADAAAFRTFANGDKEDVNEYCTNNFGARSSPFEPRD